MQKIFFTNYKNKSNLEDREIKGLVAYESILQELRRGHESNDI